MRPAFSQRGFEGLIGAARAELTPPPGIFMRAWGAATHEVSEGNHRNLAVTALALKAHEPDAPSHVLIGLDSCTFKSPEDEWFLRGAVVAEGGVAADQVMLNLSHTHSHPSLSLEDASQPGGHLIPSYRETVQHAVMRAVREALAACAPATLTWAYGSCHLAANRDWRREAEGRVLCGFNPESAADDTLVVGRVADRRGVVRATVVNYACHPTTLAWENRLISPDYVGAMRETVEAQTAGAPCLFLQGASGELAPREQYTSDTAVADRHGRQLGYAVLAALEGMLPPGQGLEFDRAVESGAVLAAWRYAPAPSSRRLRSLVVRVEQPLKPDLPALAEIEAQLAATADPVRQERLRRLRRIRRQVGSGPQVERRIWVWQVGDAFLVGQSDETYSLFQRELRREFPEEVLVVMNLVNGSCGYQPPAAVYPDNPYQVWQTPFAAGCLERTLRHALAAVRRLREAG